MIEAMMLAAAPPETEPPWELVPPVAAPCPLPAESWGATLDADTTRDRNAVVFQGGELRWNGLPIDERTLTDYLQAIAKMHPQPRTMLYSDGVDCAGLRRIAAMIAEEANCTPRDCVVIFESRLPPATVLPAPPAPPAMTRKATPRGSPQSWITNHDYPATALRAGQSGTVGFRLDLDALGIPKQCTVTSSSGSKVLDDRTCALMVERARFLPAENGDGRAVASSWSSRMRWELPDGYTPPPQTQRLSWVNVVQFTIADDGTISGCADQYFGVPGRPKFDACEGVLNMPASERAEIRGASKGPVTLMYRYEHRVAGVTMAPAPEIPASFHAISRIRISFELSAMGEMSGCTADYSPQLPPGAPTQCDRLDEYLYAPGQAPATVTIIHSLLTTGDTNVLMNRAASLE